MPGVSWSNAAADATPVLGARPVRGADPPDPDAAEDCGADAGVALDRSGAAQGHHARTDLGHRDVGLRSEEDPRGAGLDSENRTGGWFAPVRGLAADSG